MPENAQCPDGTQLSIGWESGNSGGSDKSGGDGEGTKESGFTFLEMILVLSVVSVVTAIIIPIGDKWIQAESEEDALQAFIASIHNLQAYSMANHVVTRLDFKNSGTEYITSVPGKGTES